MNTKIEYMYRDASNYKTFNEAILKGSLSDKEKREIISTLFDGEYFIPEQVGLEADRFDEYTDDDHSLCELSYEDFTETDEAPTIDMTAKELYRKFIETNGDWDFVTYGYWG